MMQRRLMCPKNSMFGILSFKINPNFRPAIQTSCTHVLRGEVDQCWKEFDKKGNRLIIYILFKFWLDRSPVDLYCSFLCSNKGLETFFVLHTYKSQKRTFDLVMNQKWKETQLFLVDGNIYTPKSRLHPTPQKPCKSSKEFFGLSIWI